MSRPKLERPNFKLGRYKGKPNLYIKWVEGGAGRCVSTGTDDEITARQHLADFIAGWNSPPAQSEQTVKMAIDAYLKFKKEQYIIKGSAVEHYATAYKSLEFALTSIRPQFDHLKLSQITRQNGRDYIAKRKKDNVVKMGNEVRHPSNATIAKELAVLNAALNHVKREGWIGKIPMMQIPPAPPPKDKWMNQEQVKLFLNALKTPHIKLFSLLALHTLSRKTAILQLKWSQVDMDNRLIDFNVPGVVRTNKRRVPVPIGNVLYAALAEAKILRQTDYVIEYGDKPMLDIKKAFSKVAAQVKMTWITPHVLRHTGATLMAQHGVPLFQIAGIMGDDLNTVMKHYAKHHPDYLKEAVSKLDEMYG